MFSDPFVLFAAVCAMLSTALLLWFLVWKPQVTRATKLLLLLAIGIFPIATAGTGNIAGYHATKSRHFCGSCHVMTAYEKDSGDPNSKSLAARHGRNEMFGQENCYSCHADYGMFGTITTKIGGMRHVYEYVLHYRNTPDEEFQAEINIRHPFQNETCMRCHSTRNPLFLKIGDHASAADDIRSGKVSCASDGCHGPAHPFSKEVKKKRKMVGAVSEVTK